MSALERWREAVDARRGGDALNLRADQRLVSAAWRAWQPQASEEWRRAVSNGENLRKFTESTTVNVINPPRDGKKLLVLDLDHALLDPGDKLSNFLCRKIPFRGHRYARKARLNIHKELRAQAGGAVSPHDEIKGHNCHGKHAERMPRTER